MHVMVAWEIDGDVGGREAEIRDAVGEALEDYSWVRALGNVYIVKVRSEADRLSLGERLKHVVQEKGGINFIYTPAMEGGRYNGWLPRDLWSEIRHRAEHVE